MLNAKKLSIAVLALGTLTIGQVAGAMEMKENRQERMEKRDTKKVEMTIDAAACVKPAVTTRENSLKSAFDAYSASVSSAMSTRSSALASAYSNSDTAAIKKGISDAWVAFRDARKAAGEKFRTDRKAAWSTFAASVKSCKGTLRESSTTTTQEVVQ
jgi:hypothetical protein